MRTGKRGRPGALDDTDYAKLVATWFANGATREQMSEEFGVSTWTITQWRKDVRVKAHTHKIIEDRILSVARKIDNVLEARLQNAENMSTKDLLAMRKEFVGGALRQQTEKADEVTTIQAMEAIEDDPEFMEKLAALMAGRSTPAEA
jgi:hypothetical protein